MWTLTLAPHNPWFVLDHPWLWVALIGVIGLCVGSFVTMASYRWPRDLEWVKTPSHCPACSAKLGWRDLFPIFSWVTARGKCRHCGCRVSPRYPLTELICAALWIGLFLYFGLTVVFWIIALFATALLILCVADLETGLIPDQLHWFLFPLGVLWHYLIGSDVGAVTLCAATALGIGLLLHYGWFWLRGYHGLGFGDVKFLLIVGLWLGDVQALVPFLFLAGALGVFSGLLWKCCSRDPRFPFGPALAMALFLLVIFPQAQTLFWQMIAAAVAPLA